MSLNFSKLLLILAFVLFLLGALVAGGVISMSNGGWLLYGGLAAWVLAALVP